MSKLQIKLPAAVRSFSMDDRRQILAALTKALNVPSEQPRGGRSMWDSADDPLIAALEDEFYTELDATGQKMLASLLVLLDLPVEELQKGPGDRYRISDLVKKMRSKGRGWKRILRYGVVDSPLLLIRKVDQNIRDQFQKIDKLAEKFIVRSGLLGLYRSQEENVKLTITAAMLDQLPETLKAAKKEPFPFRLWTDERQAEMVSLSPQEYRSIEQSVVHAAEKLSQIADNHRAGVKELIIQSQKERWGSQKLSQALFDAYGDHNRDWRRVAITELAMATNDAYLASLNPGDLIQVATVPGACPHCQQLLEGKTFIVSDGPMADGYKYIWPGKTNIGRKTAEWWPCCPLHPHCRHRWMRVGRAAAQPEREEAALSHEQEAAIHRYIGSESYVLNDKLRRGLPLTREEGAWVTQLDAAMKKIPQYRGDVTRSLYFSEPSDLKDFLNTHPLNGVVRYKQYISTTKGEMYNSAAQVQLYIFDSMQGRDISKFNPGEQEILFSRDSRFVVKEIERIGATYHVQLGEYDNDE